MTDQTNASETAWKQLRLSLERPYKDDKGDRIPILYDLTPDGERIYEMYVYPDSKYSILSSKSKESSSAKLEANLRRIFVERGPDFFQRRDDPQKTSREVGLLSEENTEESASLDDAVPKPMTVEELYMMRSEIIPQLFIALGEMSHARDLLNAILSEPQVAQAQSESTSILSATTVTKPPPITSVQAFNAQLTIGSKDEALRKASKLFKVAAESMERSRVKGEKYWVDALRTRRANWGLTPAPLPHGSTIGKGADKTAKDFIVSYGLEGSPAAFRRRAIAQLTTFGDVSHDLVFPFHQDTRLRVSITTQNGSAAETCIFNYPSLYGTMNIDTVLKNAQVKIVDQEIFSLLVKEASSLPTASAQVSERLIIINAVQGLDLAFELVDGTNLSEPSSSSSKNGENTCELIYHVLHVLLLRKHSGSAEKSLGSSKKKEVPTPILQPIIDILQYQVFCERIEVEMRKAVGALNAANIPSTVSFTAVGESGEHLVSSLSERGNKVVSGEAVIRIDDWHTIRFTFLSPSTFTAHLSQATLSISSLPQLSQLLMDEIERCVLQKICSLGREICQTVDGIWFVDLDRCVARWEGCVLNFQISYGDNFSLSCSAFRLDSTTGNQGSVEHYSQSEMPLFTWVKNIIKAVL